MKIYVPVLGLLLLFPGVGLAAETVDPVALVKKVDALLAPQAFRAKLTMTTHRSDNTEHIYKMEILKLGHDKLRANFSFPPDQAGTQILRDEDNMWMYVVNLKRAIRVASKQQLMGGDFNNNDLMRIHLADDYTPTLQSEDETQWVLELKAKDDTVSYDKIIMTVRKSDGQPMEQKIYTVSGKHVKTLTFENPTTFGAVRRPAKLTMKDELTDNRWSVVIYESVKVDLKLSESLFTLNQLGR